MSRRSGLQETLTRGAYPHRLVTLETVQPPAGVDRTLTAQRWVADHPELKPGQRVRLREYPELEWWILKVHREVRGRVDGNHTSKSYVGQTSGLYPAKPPAEGPRRVRYVWVGRQRVKCELEDGGEDPCLAGTPGCVRYHRGLQARGVDHSGRSGGIRVALPAAPPPEWTDPEQIAAQPVRGLTPQPARV